MNQITPKPPMGQKAPRERFSTLERKYYQWLHTNCICCLSLRPVFDIAHTGKKHMAMKAPLKSCLPLTRELHVIEEAGRDRFWKSVNIPDHLAWAERLFDIFEANDDPTTLLMDMHERANLIAVREYLERN